MKTNYINRSTRTDGENNFLNGIDQNTINSGYVFSNKNINISSSNLIRTGDSIISTYKYNTNIVTETPTGLAIEQQIKTLNFKTNTKVPKTGVLIIGLGGNNGTTTVAGIIANRQGMTWMTKEGEQKADYLGSLTQSSTVNVGSNIDGQHVWVPLKNLLPMINPNDLVIGGWDISNFNLKDAMIRSKVLDINLQTQLYVEMEKITPLPSIYYKDFIASNQEYRANNLINY